MREVRPYSGLSVGYDLVMEHVDYVAWARYVHRLLRRYVPGARSLLELGCGTGSLALLLQPMGPYDYLATDGSPDMVDVARAKAGSAGSPIRFAVVDFLDLHTDRRVDAAILLYDGLNYVLDSGDVAGLFRGVAGVLETGGVFVFDVSTPANSENNAKGFEDEGEEGGFAYRRTSSYDPESRIHTTVLDMSVGTRTFREVHRERAYREEEIRHLLGSGGFLVEAALDGFTLHAADGRSERIHFVARSISDVSASGAVANLAPNEDPSPK